MTHEVPKRDLYDWANQARSVWTTLGNSRCGAEQEFVPVREHPWPHYYPPTSLSDDESPLVLPAVGQRITLSVELACRIVARGENVSAADAQKLIRSYHVFVAVRDNSYLSFAQSCSNFPHFGKREDPTCDYDYEVTHGWADGFAQLSKARTEATSTFPSDAAMQLRIDGFEPVDTNTSEYVHHFPSVIEVITRFVCVEEGDVISLGCAGPFITLEPGKLLPGGTHLHASIDGIGSMSIPVIDERNNDNYYTQSFEGASIGGFV